MSDQNVFDSAKDAAREHLDTLNRAKALLTEIEQMAPSLSPEEREELAKKLEAMLQDFTRKKG